MKIIGIDIFGCRDKATGLCCLTDSIDEVAQISTDEEVIAKVREQSPDIVVIGSPTSLPEKGNLRKAEEEMMKRGLKHITPRGLLAVEQMVVRAMNLKRYFEEKGMLVIETSPKAFCDLLRIPKTENYIELKRFLSTYGIDLKKNAYAACETNAIICSFVGRLFLEAKVEFLGDEDEGQIVLPRIK